MSCPQPQSQGLYWACWMCPLWASEVDLAVLTLQLRTAKSMSRALSLSLCPVLPIAALSPTPCYRWAGLGQVSSETKEPVSPQNLAVTGRRHRAKGNHRKCPDGLSLFPAGGGGGEECGSRLKSKKAATFILNALVTDLKLD